MPGKSAPASPPPLFAVGRLARAHGIRGRVLVAPFNEESLGLERVTALWLAPRGTSAPSQPAPPSSHPSSTQPKRYEVTHAERVNLGYLFQLRGIDDRSGAEALRGLEVSVARDELPALDEGELFTADLIGLQVFDAQAPEPRAALGEVVALEAAGRNELLVIQLKSGEQVLAPLALLRDADAGKKQLLLEIPEGLFEAQLAPSSAADRSEREERGDGGEREESGERGGNSAGAGRSADS